MKKITTLTAIALAMVSCGTQQALTITIEKKERFKEYTKDICINHPHEVKLAQALYIEMIKSNE